MRVYEFLNVFKATYGSPKQSLVGSYLFAITMTSFTRSESLVTYSMFSVGYVAFLIIRSNTSGSNFASISFISLQMKGGWMSPLYLGTMSWTIAPD